MSSSEGQADGCPYCQTSFEIVSVKFKFGGVAIVASCPNCAFTEEWRTPQWKTFDKIGKLSAGCFELLSRMVSRVGPLSFRLRYFVTMLFVTVIATGLLRHVFHVSGGLSREDIRAGALIVETARSSDRD